MEQFDEMFIQELAAYLDLDVFIIRELERRLYFERGCEPLRTEAEGHKAVQELIKLAKTL